MPALTDSEELNEFRLSFVQSSQEKVSDIEGLFLKLENTLNSNEANEARRNILTKLHSIKGAARAYSMIEVATICHKLEDYCIEMADHFGKDSFNKYIESTLQLVDALNSYFAEFSKSKSIDTLKFREKYPEIFYDDREVTSNKVNNQSTKNNEEKSQRKLNILQIGLTKPILKQIKFSFSGIKHKLGFCSDPTDAFYRLSQEKFDLVLVTNLLQPIGGIAFSGAIKLHWEDKSPKIVLLSSQPLEIEESKKKFIDDVIVKNQNLPKNLRSFVFDTFFPDSVSTPIVESKKLTLTKCSRVFCIDDDENILNLINMLFEEKSQVALYSKTTKSDPMENLLNFSPELIICDVNIPGINITEFFRKFRANPKFKNVKAVFLTADVDTKLSKELIDLGAEVVFDKAILLDGFFEHFKKIGIDF